MAKTINQLTSRKVEHLKKKGWYADGAGLYLKVKPSGAKSWAYRYQINGKQKWQGLGAVTKLNGLEAARKAAAVSRQLVKDKIDPIEHKNQQALEKELKAARTVTFKECAVQYIDSHKAGWKNAKHINQWSNTLETYAYPVIGDLPVSKVDTEHVLKVLEPIWFTKTETASRVRQRIERVLSWATVRKFRTGFNPALWRGHLDQVLPQRTKVQKPKHFSAINYREIPDYFSLVRKTETIASRALAFIVLTAVRSAEGRCVTYSELNLEEGVWTIPADRMKAGREHRIPLSDEAMEIIAEMEVFKRDADDYVFTGMKPGRPVSEAALRKLIKGTHPEITIHGFRSSFRDWAAEQTNYPREVAEAALAHSLKDKVEAAYRRTDLFEKRRLLMNSWEDYCLYGKATAKVVPINKVKELD